MAAKNNKKVAREGYLKENYHYFHLRDTAGQERDYHFHEFDKIVLLLAGRVDYAMESSVYTLRPWDILLVRHHTIHKALIDKSEPYERVILYLDRRFFDRLMPDTVLEANKAAKTVALVTGPEGGFAPFEADLARIVGLHICSMGERILRCETAPVVATTAVMYATGNLS